MEREKKVVDASVAVKWFLDECDSDKAIKLWKKHKSQEIRIIVPELLFIEVLNALKYKKLNEEELKKVNEALWNSQFIIEKLNKTILDKSAAISIKNNLTIYDSIYIALSQLHGCVLITADESLSKHENVNLLNKSEL
jgi:predicted nucleic acid-binding protein